MAGDVSPVAMFRYFKVSLGTYVCPPSAETLNLTKADTLSYMVRDYTVMKNKERLREMQSLGLGH